MVLLFVRAGRPNYFMKKGRLRSRTAFCFEIFEAMFSRLLLAGCLCRRLCFPGRGLGIRWFLS
jgi:hypothetical protein